MAEVIDPVARRVERPRSVQLVLRLLWGMVGLSAVAAICAVVFQDDLVLAWAQGNRQARQIVEEGGLAALEASLVSIPAFSQLAVVLLGVLALLTWMLGVFFAAGEKWARMSLTVAAAAGIFITFVTLASGLPTIFWVVAAAAIAVCVALIVMLWHTDTTAYVTRLR